MSQVALSLAYVALGLTLLTLSGDERRSVAIISGALVDENAGAPLEFVDYPTVWFWTRALAAALVVHAVVIPVVYWWFARSEEEAFRSKLRGNAQRPEMLISYVGIANGIATRLGIGAGAIGLAVAAEAVTSGRQALHAGGASLTLGLLVGALVTSSAVWSFRQRARQYRAVVAGQLDFEVTYRPTRWISIAALAAFPLFFGLAFLYAVCPELIAFLTGGQVVDL